MLQLFCVLSNKQKTIIDCIMAELQQEFAYDLVESKVKV